MLRFLRWLFGIKHPSSTDFTPQQTDNSPSVVETILVKPTISVIQEQQIDFSRENNLIREGIWEDPPRIINGDGTVYYKDGDPRNTYDPRKMYQYEDYDGTIRYYGGSGDISEGASDPDEIYSDEVDNNPDIKKYWELDKQWQEKNKRVDYREFLVNKPKYNMGIDYGGYDGNTFAVCLMRDGQIIENIQRHDEQKFREEVLEMVEHYKIDGVNILMEKHEKFNNIQPVLEWST